MRPVIRLALAGCLLVLIAACGGSMSDADAPAPPKSATPGQYRAWVADRFLPWMESSRGVYNSVPRADGQLLRTLVEKTKSRRGLELGSGNGYSAIWIGLGMEKTGGSLVTVEIDPKRAAACASYVEKAGLEKIVSCIKGDALKVTPGLDGPFDFMFVDLGSMDVLPFIKAVEPKLAAGALITFHAVKFVKNYANFLKYARAKGWFIGAIKPKDGMGLVLVSSKPLNFGGMPIKPLSF
jgi:predicted O-methyltransferase YrrM